MKTKQLKKDYPESRTKGLKRGGVVPSRSAIYNKLSVHSDKAIKELIDLLSSRNESIKLGAIKLILDKSIPDLRAMELQGQEGGAFIIKVISYGHTDPLQLYTDTPNAGSLERPASLSSPQLAPEGKEDNPSNQPAN